MVAVGAGFLALGWGLSSQVREPWHLMLSLGLVAGLGMSATWAPCSGTVVRWFTRLRGTAVSITTTGGSVGSLVVPTVTALLIGALTCNGPLRSS